MPEIDYERLRDLAEKAAPGPWLVRWDGEEPWVLDDELPREVSVGAGTYLRHPSFYTSADLILETDISGCDADEAAPFLANAEFVAAANPATVLALLEEIDGLRKRIGQGDDAYAAAREDAIRARSELADLREKVDGAVGASSIAEATRQDAPRDPGADGASELDAAYAAFYEADKAERAVGWALHWAAERRMEAAKRVRELGGKL